jgi:hypothetical protein
MRTGVIEVEEDATNQDGEDSNPDKEAVAG